MSNIWCPRKRERFARLPTFVVLMKDVNDISVQVKGKTVLAYPFNILRFLENLCRWGSDCDFHRHVRNAHGTMFVGWHDVELYAVLPSERGSLYDLAPAWR